MIKFEQLLTDTLGVAKQDLEKAKAFQNEFGGRIELILENMGVIDESNLCVLYECYFGLKTKTLNEIEGLLTSNAILNQVESEEAVELTIADQGEILLTSDPFDPLLNIYFSRLEKKHELIIYLMQRSDLETLINSNVSDEVIGTEFSTSELDKLKEAALEAPVVNLLNNLIQKGLKLNASDMHIEPVNNNIIVRYRVDGVLKKDETIAKSLQMALITRLKILSNMDIAEKRRPQDGKIALRISGEELDIRVSCLPLANGESFVMRFLRSESLSYELNDLGIETDVQQELEQDIKKTSGVILLTGPTGSGKTTTLYSFLSKLNDERVKIITLEDPVEYQLENINQVQVNAEIGFDFADGLRSIVRQDPDIIMLGEIRDKNTAQIALQSALTGHLVFSTVHTNDAPSAYTRLLDLGIDEFLLEAALVSIVAQRLARKLCQHCCVSDPDTEIVLLQPTIKKIIADYKLSHQITGLKKPVGCDKCSFTGYKGRVALIEYLKCDEDISLLRKDNNFLIEARKLNKSKGYRNLLADGILKAVKGQTTIDEVFRVAG